MGRAVDLGEILVETRIATDDPDRLRIGLPMELVLAPLPTPAGAEAVMTFAFAPGGEG